MKKHLTCFLSAMMIFAVGCERFDDSLIWEKLNSLESRIVVLEQLCRQMNTNISSLQTIVDALQDKDYVTNISPITEDGKVIGYTIAFSKSGTITIYHGKDGKDGQDGTNGEDGYTPVIGIAKDTDGLYYWTLDGGWLLDSENNKVKAVGIDGEDGADGEDGEDGADGAGGKDGMTPKLKIENGYWFVSYDNGVNWVELGKAIGEDGEDGEDGDSIFEDVTYDDDYVYITLTDGTELIVPRHNDNEANIPNNQIWYTAATAKVRPYSEVGFGATIVSNQWDGITGKGVITFDGDINLIGERAFDSCISLTSITIPNSVAGIGNDAFSGCDNLTSIIIPDGVTSIGEDAFFGCENLTSIIIPDSVTEIGPGAFSGCECLASFYGKFASEDNRCLIIDGVLNSFAPAGLTEYAVTNNVTGIGADAFSGCDNLKSITIPDSVTSIGDFAFENCGNLTSITIPDGVTSIGTRAFASCWNLISVYCKATTPPSLGEYAFKDLRIINMGSGYANIGCAIYIPAESVNAYKAATDWADYAVDIVGYDF